NGDSVFFIYGYKVNKDTLGAEHLRHYHRITGKVQLPGFQAGDSVNPYLHRELFYDKYPRCYKIRLTLRDTFHPMKCETTVSSSVALLPPSAKRLQIADHYCYGYGAKAV